MPYAPVVLYRHGKAKQATSALQETALRAAGWKNHQRFGSAVSPEPVAVVPDPLALKQDASTAATDTELSAVITAERAYARTVFVASEDGSTFTWNDEPIVLGGGASANLADGVPYTFSPAAHASYDDPAPVGNIFRDGAWVASGQVLTDGVRSLSYNDGNTVAWNAGSTSVVLRFDLGEALAAEQVVVHGWHGASGMYRPTGIVVESSPDDATWTPRATHTGLASGGQNGLTRFRMEASFDSATARYWRVTLTRDTDMLLLDEVEIR